MTRPTCTAAELVPGAVVVHGGRWDGDPSTRCVILRDREPDRRDIFGRPLQSWWARREDTGEEGFLDYGEALVDIPLERLR